jgi:hypothetical protein
MAELRREDVKWNELRRGQVSYLVQVTKPRRYAGSFAVVRVADDAMIESFPADQSRKALQRFRREEFALFDCVYLGGYGVNLEPKTRYDLLFGDGERLVVRREGSSNDTGSIPYRDIERIDVGGPGEVTTGGGFVGGGFGVQGAAEGMAIATILNSLSTRTTVETIIDIVAEEAQMIFLNQEETPRDLGIWLSPIVGRIKASRRLAQETAVSASPTGVEQLIALADLHTRGLLTEEEFTLAKQRLLG